MLSLDASYSAVDGVNTCVVRWLYGPSLLVSHRQRCQSRHDYLCDHIRALARSLRQIRFLSLDRVAGQANRIFHPSAYWSGNSLAYRNSCMVTYLSYRSMFLSLIIKALVKFTLQKLSGCGVYSIIPMSPDLYPCFDLHNTNLTPFRQNLSERRRCGGFSSRVTRLGVHIGN